MMASQSLKRNIPSKRKRFFGWKTIVELNSEEEANLFLRELERGRSVEEVKGEQKYLAYVVMVREDAKKVSLQHIEGINKHLNRVAEAQRDKKKLLDENTILKNRIVELKMEIMHLKKEIGSLLNESAVDSLQP